MPSAGFSSLFNLGSSDIETEAQVETRFVAPLLKELGYPNEAIIPKGRLPKLIGNDGSRQTDLEVDFILNDSDGSGYVIVEAKAPSESIAKHWGQAASYALSHNAKLSGAEDGVEFLLVTNGLTSALYPHDRKNALVTMTLGDFTSGGPAWVELKRLLKHQKRKQVTPSNQHVFEAISPSSLNKRFNEAHDLIWKKEKLSPTDAFYEFCKFVFLKMREDKNREGLPDDTPRHEIKLTSAWLDAVGKSSKHPVRDILFNELRQELQDAIHQGKKRIFEDEEEMRLTESTCKELVKKFEDVNLSAIDEDLNGRMFERFLNHQVRGKELGQYFTPRPVVDFMTRMALHGWDVTDPPKIIDACAGTAGFLIEAMAHLVSTVRNDSRLTNVQKERLADKIRNDCLFGVEGNLGVTRVARINMYLHGDGGSHVFHGDGLDRNPSVSPDMKLERTREIKEQSATIKPGRFDIALSNPPFSMGYSSGNADERKILEQRGIAKGLTSAKSNLLFLDRYWELLRPGGQLLIVLDDTILNGRTHIKTREWILENFVIVGIHSLPFNAFFKAEANIKTSILHLRKKERPDERQGHVFMSISRNIGHDSHLNDTPEKNSLGNILTAFFEWKRSGQCPPHIERNEDPNETLECPEQIWLEPPESLDTRRFDAFYYSPELRECRQTLERNAQISEIELKRGKDFKLVKKITAAEKIDMSDVLVKYIEIGDVTPYGLIVTHLNAPFSKIPSRGQYLVRAGDVLIALNNSSRGTVVLVPEQFDGAVCTSGFLVVRPRSREEGKLLWHSMRSEYARVQNYYLAQTASQPELKIDVWKDEFLIAMPVGDAKHRALQEVKQLIDILALLDGANEIKLQLSERD